MITSAAILVLPFSEAPEEGWLTGSAQGNTERKLAILNLNINHSIGEVLLFHFAQFIRCYEKGDQFVFWNLIFFTHNGAGDGNINSNWFMQTGNERNQKKRKNYSCLEIQEDCNSKGVCVHVTGSSWFRRLRKVVLLLQPTRLCSSWLRSGALRDCPERVMWIVQCCALFQYHLIACLACFSEERVRTRMKKTDTGHFLFGPPFWRPIEKGSPFNQRNSLRSWRANRAFAWSNMHFLHEFPADVTAGWQILSYERFECSKVVLRQVAQARRSLLSSPVVSCWHHILFSLEFLVTETVASKSSLKSQGKKVNVVFFFNYSERLLWGGLAKLWSMPLGISHWRTSVCRWKPLPGTFKLSVSALMSLGPPLFHPERPFEALTETFLLTLQAFLQKYQKIKERTTLSERLLWAKVLCF